MPFRVPDNDDNDMEHNLRPLTPPTRKRAIGRSLDSGPDMPMPRTSPYASDTDNYDNDDDDIFVGIAPTNASTAASAQSSTKRWSKKNTPSNTKVPSLLIPQIATPPPPQVMTPPTTRTIDDDDDDFDDDDDEFGDEDDDGEEEEGPREMPWLETVEEVLRRMRRRRSQELQEEESKRAELHDLDDDNEFPSLIFDEPATPTTHSTSALEVSLNALTSMTAAHVLSDRKKEDDPDGEKDKLTTLPSLQPLDVQIIPEEKDWNNSSSMMTSTTMMMSPSSRTAMSIPGAHHMPGPPSSPSGQHEPQQLQQQEAVAVDWTHQLQMPSFLNTMDDHQPTSPSHHPQPYPNDSPSNAGYDMGFNSRDNLQQQHQQQQFSRIGSPLSDGANESLSLSSRLQQQRPFQPQPTQQLQRPHWIYVPSSSTLTQNNVDSHTINSNNNNSSSYHQHQASLHRDNDASTTALAPSSSSFMSHSWRSRQHPVMTPPWFGFSFQRRTNTTRPHTTSTLPMIASRSNSSQHSPPDRPLEATVVHDHIDDEDGVARAEPIFTARTTPSIHLHPSLTGHGLSQSLPPQQHQQIQHRATTERERNHSMITLPDEIEGTGPIWNKFKHTLLLLSVACVAVLIVIILVLAMVVYPNKRSSSSSSHNGRSEQPSSAPSSGNNSHPLCTWQTMDENDITGTSVALSSGGSVLATAGVDNVNGTMNVAFARAYVKNGRKLVPMGSTIPAGRAVVHNVFPPLALSGDGNTLGVGTVSGDSNETLQGGFVIYEFNNNNNVWNQLGQTITAWSNSNSSGDIWGWSLAMSSNGFRIATAVVEKQGTNQTFGGSVRVLQYITEDDQWEDMGDAFQSKESENLHSWSVHLSQIGTILAVGSMYNNSDATAGFLRVQVYGYADSPPWYPIGSMFTGPCELEGNGGDPVALSEDGQVLALSMDGYVQVLRYNGTDWHPMGSYIYGDGPSAFSGVSLALADGGNRLVVGTPEAAEHTGKVRIFKFDSSHNEWISIGNVTGPDGDGFFGAGVALNAENGAILAAGSKDLKGNGSGHVLMFSSEDGCV